jgi:16S rRNA (cytosine1402-N4)-methyltransferase
MSVLPLLMRIWFIKRFLRFTVEKCGWDFGGFGSFLSSIWCCREVFRFDAELDMRMSQNDLNAYKVVNEYDETNLKRVFLDYGELKNAPVLQGPL